MQCLSYINKKEQLWIDMNKKKFTIITVCYNAENCIKETIESLLNQTCNDYEYIVKDGVSTDRTLEIAHALLDGRDNVQIVYNPDKGIYDAMNQAVEMAMGEYVYFLNAGDCFSDENVLKKAKEFICEKEPDVAYGNILSIANEKKELRTYGAICSRKLYFLIGACICHQSMFVKRQLFKEKIFDINYRVCADREWQLFFINRKKKFVPMYYEVASVLEDGFSKNNVEVLEKETLKCLQKHCKHGAWIYSFILNVKKSKVLLKIIRKIERLLFVKKHDET